MNEPEHAKDVVDRFLERQREMYAGGGVERVRELLADDIVWHVPGTSPIAGDYRGRDAVVAYFLRRRALAGGAITITQRGEMHDEEVLVQLADGRASLGGRDVEWRTTGVYRVAGGKIAEAWLVPLDGARFDRAWASTRRAPFVHVERVRPEECTAGAMLGHPRFLEFLEAAFVECWRERVGRLEVTVGPDRRLTVAAVNVRYLGPVRADDRLRVEVAIDRLTDRSIEVHYDAFVAGTRVAEARARHVCLDAAGVPTTLPEAAAALDV
jgi:acyl-CoA thioesterase FadM/ketosteroid isomerase-like protein